MHMRRARFSLGIGLAMDSMWHRFFVFGYFSVAPCSKLPSVWPSVVVAEYLLHGCLCEVFLARLLLQPVAVDN